MKESWIMDRVAVHVPGHPAANNRGYILRSRYVMEQKLGRLLSSEEHVHHKDEDTLNDAPENLELKSRSGHVKDHWVAGKYGSRRVLNYERIATLIQEGWGYKKIAKMMGYNVHSTQSACRKIRLGHI